MSNQIDSTVKKERSRILRNLATKKNLDFRRSLVGRCFSAVTLKQSNTRDAFAVTDNYVTVRLETGRQERVRLTDVELTAATMEHTLARELNSRVSSGAAISVFT